MVAIGLCLSCGPTPEWLATSLGTGFMEPEHCYGSGDQPAPKGVMGGFQCICECRHCTCGRIKLNTTVVTNSRNWNPDCTFHGTDSEWYKTVGKAKLQKTVDRSVDLQRQAAVARRRARDAKES